MKKNVFSKLALVGFLVGSFAASACFGQGGDWGSLTGQIVIDGDVPKMAPEDVEGNPDKAACLVDGKIPVDDGIVANDKKQLRDVFVLMYVGRGAAVPEKFHPSYDETKKVKLTLDNQKCRFVPKSVFARTGQTLIMKNSDDVGHNCHITTFQQEHNINIPAGKEIELKLEDTPDKIPGEVRCDIHKWMDSVIFIRDNPYVAISDETGKFKIENIPAGDWKFQFWHKKAGYLKTLEIKGYTPDRRGCIEATIAKDKSLDLGVLKLPAEAFTK
ncbi:MAG: hypothetical protein P8J27_10045 [Mariniblastus sp.]|nr:hypothetical protein [Mariniblastus sp.]